MALSGRACKAKGSRAEAELVSILDELQLYSQRVLGSGAYAGASADLKIGVTLNEDGTKPEKDEGNCVLRAEVKNRVDNPDYHEDFSDDEVYALIPHPKLAGENLWNHYNQDKITKVVAIRRNKIPLGAKSRKDYDQMWMMCMPVTEWVELVKKAHAYDEQKKVAKPKKVKARG